MKTHLEYLKLIKGNYYPLVAAPIEGSYHFKIVLKVLRKDLIILTCNQNLSTQLLVLIRLQNKSTLTYPRRHNLSKSLDKLKTSPEYREIDISKQTAKNKIITKNKLDK